MKSEAAVVESNADDIYEAICVSCFKRHLTYGLGHWWIIERLVMDC